MGNWEDNVRRVTPYTPGEQPDKKDIIKLNTNENPYPPSPKAVQALRDVDPVALRRYPQPDCALLRDALAASRGLKKSEVFAGVGSDDVLAMSFLTFFNGRKPVLFPDITYSFYEVWAGLFCIPYRTVPLDENFLLRPGDYSGACGGIVFPNPNAPTGELLPLEAVEEIVSSHPDVVVIVDEAYIDFGGVSAVPLIRRYDNLLVTGTLSKSAALAGMRIGFAFGSEKLIACLDNVKYSYNSYTLSTPALAAGTAAVEDRAYLEEITQRIAKTRERAKEALRGLGFQVSDSKANFLFVHHPKVHARVLFEQLRAADIYVRHFSQPRIDDYLRISIGTDEEMDRLVDFLTEYLKN